MFDPPSHSSSRNTTPPPDDALSIAHLTKRYDTGTEAVSDLSLSVKAGEFFGFLGPNGAGKTTTIHCITGIARITEGSIHVFGHNVVSDYRNARRQIGLSPQEYNVDIFATVREILDWIAGFHGMRKKERKERSDYVLGRFKLEAHAHKKFQALSGGLKRRVMLARALVHDPKLLILDEPTAGVDVELRRELWIFLEDLHREGKTIILTSHYLEEVERLCDRIAIVQSGRIVSDAPKEEYLKGGATLEQEYLTLTGATPAALPQQP